MSKKRRKKSKKKSSNLVANIILTLAIAVFLFSVVKLVVTLVPYYKGEKDYDSVKEIAIVTDKDDYDEVQNNGDKFIIDFDALMELNPDTIGWIRFDEPEIISYPIVKSHDNEEYLTKTFSDNDNKLGSIFVDMNNKSDFSDRNTLIYGHNMRVGNQMFSQIRKYGDNEFREENPYFYIYTPDNVEHKYHQSGKHFVVRNQDGSVWQFQEQVSDHQEVRHYRSV